MSKVITPLTSFGCIEIKGKNTESFLQGQLTCDINDVTENTTILCGYCNEKGRLVASGYISKNKKNYQLFINKQLIPYTLQKLKQYAIFSNVSVTENQDIAIVGFIGEPSIEGLPTTKYNTITTENVKLTRISDNYSMYILYAEKSEIIALQEKLSSDPDTQMVLDHYLWEQANIDAGITCVHTNTLERLTPHMINYHAFGAVSFKKGCFLGQEIIARTHHRGRTKRKLYRAVVKNTANVNIGTEVITAKGESAGFVVRQSSPHKDQTNVLIVLADHTIKSKLKVDNNELSVLELVLQHETA